MIQLYLFAISITWLLTSHKDAKQLQNWIFYKAYKADINDHMEQYYKVINTWWHGLYRLITCYYCMGFWIGCVTAIFRFTFHHIGNLWDVAEFGFLNALFSLIVCSVIEKL